MSWLIYDIVCLVTGKKYVGKTKRTLEKRWYEHKHSFFCRALSNAIRKYGASNFEMTLLEVCDSEEDANKAEIRWIAELNTKVPNGYNLDDGGSLHCTSESTRELNRQSGRRRWEGVGAQQRSDEMKKVSRTIPTERRSETFRVSRNAWLASSTAEQRSEVSRKRLKTMTSDQLSEMGRKANLSRSPELRCALGRIGGLAAREANSPERRSEIAKNAGVASGNARRLAKAARFLSGN